MAIIGNLAEDETGHSLWGVEDADFAAAADRLACDIARRGVSQSSGSAPDTVAAVTPFSDRTASEPPRQVG
jgi:hypothetical protein